MLYKERNEIRHGRKLSVSNPELIWGWATPAGKVRAKRRAAMIINGGHLQSEKKILEIGCGTGLFTEMFASSRCQIIAVDISQELLEKAKKRNLPKNQVRFLAKSFELCADDESFDAIIGSSILHHLDIDSALTQIFNLLKPGGYTCFAEPNMLNPQIFIQKKIPIIKKWMGDSPDETAFRASQIRKKMRLSFFTEINIIPFDWLHPATPSLMIPVVEQIGFILEKIPVIKEFAGSLLIMGRRPKVHV